MAAGKNLGTYLNEHLAAAAGVIDLIGKAAVNNRGRPVGDFLGTLRDDIAEDKVVLESVMEGLGIERSEVKQVASRTMERLTRIRLHEKVTGSAELSLLLELEAITVAAMGKLSLCQALEERAMLDDRLAKFDIGTLADRTTAQLDNLKRHRRQAAGAAFSSDPSPDP